MSIEKALKVLGLVLAIAVASGCSGSSSKNTRSSSPDSPPNQDVADGDQNGGENVDGGAGADANTAIEGVLQDTASVTDSTANVVQVLGGTISQTELPLVDETVTDSAGNIITNVGDGVESLSAGVADGVGSISENDNALGTTLAGGSGLISETGEAVSSAGTTVEALNTMPVFAQLDEKSGVLTSLGGTVESLGALVTETGDVLTVNFTQEDGTISGLTEELTAVVRPLIINVDGTTKVIGEAIVVTPAVTGLIAKVGSAVVILGDKIGQQDSVLLASTGGVVEDVGFLLVNLDGNLIVNPEQSGLDTLDINELLEGKEPGNLLAELLNDGEPLAGAKSQLTGLLGDDQGLLTKVVMTLNVVVGGLLGDQDKLLAEIGSGLQGGHEDTLLAGLTGTVDDSLAGGLQGTSDNLIANDEGLVTGLTDTVNGLTGVSPEDEAGLVSSLNGTVSGLTGGLNEESGGLTGTVDNVTNDLLKTDDGLLGTVGGLTGGLLR